MLEAIWTMIGVCGVAGAIVLVLPEKVRFYLWGFTLAVCLALLGGNSWLFSQHLTWENNLFLWDHLSSLICLGISFFGVIVTLASLSLVKDSANQYYAYLLWTLAGALGAGCANHLLLLAVFWGITAITLYLMVNLSGPESAYPAKKTFIIVGGSDSFLLLGLLILHLLTGSWSLTQIHVEISRWLAAVAFLSLTVAALAKAGAMPFHTWIPEISEKSLVPVLAFLPASLDKLLGIYLLARICLHLFAYHQALWLLLRLIGAVTIVAAVFMALVQHNMRKLLAYHAVSQVGYMVLGLASGSPIGIMGGLFHMVNHAIYKCCLFLGAGAVEEKTGTTQLDELGGLGRKMPASFTCFFIAALAISGIPPLNGFFSKWMVYQGLIESGQNGAEPSWVVWVVMAMIGSGLTLASFLKIVHSVFLGQPQKGKQEAGEASFSIVLPMMVLAAFCILLGIFYVNLPVQVMLAPVAGLPYQALSLSTPLVFVIAGIIFGLLLYLFTSCVTIRYSPAFIGGEEIKSQMHYSGTEFYKGITTMPFLRKMFAGAKQKLFDLYEVKKQVIGYISELLRWAHSGVLDTYLSWIIFGLLVLLIIFLRP